MEDLGNEPHRASGNGKARASSDGESHAIAAEEAVLGALLLGGVDEDVAEPERGASLLL